MFNIEINYKVKTSQKYEVLFQKLGRQTIKIIKITKDLDISVAFVGPQKIRELNKCYRHKDKVTDVLSFEELDEIIICYSQAVSQAKVKKHSIKQEVSHLFVHGLLHLLGYDDKTILGAEKMEGLGQKILNI